MLHFITPNLWEDWTGGHTNKEGEGERVFLIFCQRVWDVKKLYLLLLGQLFWMPGPHPWLQTRPGCCLYVSAQPMTDK